MILFSLLLTGLPAASHPAPFARPAAGVRAPAFRSPADRGLATDFAHVRGMRDMGRLPSNRPVQVGLMMRFRHADELGALTYAQGEKRSPYYRRFLTSAQWNNYFAPDPVTYQHAAQAMQRAGFRVTKTYANRGMIVATAPSGTVERYFKTQLHAMMQPGKNDVRYANVTAAIMPAELKDVAFAVAGLQNLQTMHTPQLTLTPSRARFQLGQRRLGASFGNHRMDVPTAPPSPAPVGTSTPAANPHPDPTESPNDPLSDYTASLGGYGPPIFAIAYDYPVQHGYGGTGHAAGTVIDSDNSDADMKLEFANFDIPHTGKEIRVCTDPNNQCTICDDSTPAMVTATCDQEGESTLDAEAIATLAPDADLYEYLVNHTTSLIDLNVEAAYERVVSDNIVDAVNSSFGGCETDDPTEEYIVNQIAMEGAAKGITFSASTGDTGGRNCGVYVTNGAPQTLTNSSSPSSAYYFVAVGGTSFDPIVEDPLMQTYYTAEQAWLDGGGGYSVLEPLPAYQAAVQTTLNAASVSTVGRNTPDLAFTADGGPAFVGGTQGAGLIIFNNGTEQGSGGTSLSSPMWIAMQTTINQVKGSRSGWVDPRLYEIGADSNAYAFCFRDITVGTNEVYAAATGYDMTTGLGTPKGWELAGNE